MGRTNPTYRDFLNRYEDDFGDFRRALRYRYRQDFDRLFAGAREVADAAGYANHVDRGQLVVVSMLLAHEHAIREREAAIDELEAELATLRERVEALEDEDGEGGQEHSEDAEPGPDPGPWSSPST